jgi:methyl-accepting chemotaxis protein
MLMTVAETKTTAGSWDSLSARVRGSRSVRSALTARILLVGLAAISASLALLGVQIQRTASDQAHSAVSEQTTRTAAGITDLFNAWRDELLVASNNAALTDWYADPDRRAVLHGQIDRQLVELHAIYPTLIDEACYISFQGPELARQVNGEPAAVADLSPDESGNPFFKPTLAVAHGQVWQNAPYISPDSQRWVVSNSTPIEVGVRKVALLHFEANLDAVRTRVAAGLAPTMRARIIDTRTNRVIADTASKVAIVQAPLAKVGPWTDAAGPIRASHSVQVDPAVNGNRWVVEVSGPEPRPFTAGLLWRAAGLVVLALLAIAVVALNFASSIARPVLEVTEVAESLARGDLSRQSTVRRSDEIGRMATAVNAAVTGMLTQQGRLQDAHDARQLQLKESHQQQQLSDRQVRERAQSIIDDTAAAVLRELGEVVQRVEEVRAGAGTIDERTIATSSVTRALVEQAGAADRVVAALGDSLRRVGGIADMIGGVASQTNLLALNATIESARAGQAGAAFSIVAREVKQLASSTAQSSGEITSTIETLEREAADVAAAISRMAENVANIDTVTAEVSTVTAAQQVSVEQLDQRVAEAITRIKAMADITEDLERRAGERYGLDEPANLICGRMTHQVQIRDVSESGVGCRTDSGASLTLSAAVTINLTLDGGPVSISATIVRIDPGETSTDVGLQFADPADDVARRLRAYVSARVGRSTP